MRPASRSIEVDWGHLLLLLFIAAVVTAYLFDSRATSLSIQNLLMVQPAALIALLLCLLVLPQCIRRADPESALASESEMRQEHRQALSELGKTGLLAAAFGAFCVSLETIGFDLACWLFTGIGLYVCGERRWWVILVFTTVFTFLLISGYRMLIPFPFPLSVL